MKREEVYRQPLNLKQDKATKSSIIYLKMSCHVYVGMFAARNVDVTFYDIKWEDC